MIFLKIYFIKKKPEILHMVWVNNVGWVHKIEPKVTYYWLSREESEWLMIPYITTYEQLEKLVKKVISG